MIKDCKAQRPPRFCISLIDNASIVESAELRVSLLIVIGSQNVADNAPSQELGAFDFRIKIWRCAVCISQTPNVP